MFNQTWSWVRQMEMVLGTNLVDFGNDATKDSSVKLEIPGASTKLEATTKQQSLVIK